MPVALVPVKARTYLQQEELLGLFRSTLAVHVNYLHVDLPIMCACDDDDAMRHHHT